MNTNKSRSHVLEYIESQREHRLPLKFSKICPRSSGTIRDQRLYLNPEGLTLVAFLPDDEKFKFIGEIDKIKALNDRFYEVANLHITLLGLFPYAKTHQLNPHFEVIVKDRISKFLEDKLSSNYELTFKLEFSLIRSGTWHGINSIQIPNASNGTVVAIGELTSVGNKKFADLADELESYLKRELECIFGQEFTRKFPNLWCTLGYFDCDDFSIDSKFVDTFNEWNPLDKSLATITVSELQLVKYRLKSLNGYDSILRFPNDLYTNP